MARLSSATAERKCDRQCEIARIRIDGKTYPFGGACNRWYNMRSHIKIDAEALNHVAHYERMVFPPPSSPDRPQAVEGPKIGINKSFFVNTYFRSIGPSLNSSDSRSSCRILRNGRESI